MADLLAECTQCGQPFVVGEIGGGGMTLGNSQQDVYVESLEVRDGGVAIQGGKVGSCPSCGGSGRLPDGTYDTLRGTVTTLRRLDAEHQLWLVQALRDLPADEAPTAEQVHEVLRGVPNEVRASLAPLLQSKHWRFWLGLLVAVIAILVQHQDTRDAIDSAHRDALAQIEESRRQADDSKRQLHDEVSRLVDAIQAEDSPESTSTTTTVHPNPGRNAPCWCASGKKFKYCHGQ